MFATLIAITFIGTGPAPDIILESLQNSYQELGELSNNFKRMEKGSGACYITKEELLP